MAKSAPPLGSFLALRFWPTWIGIAGLCVLAWLPFRLRMLCGSMMGRLSWLLARERRYITSVNIGMCFPELDSQAQHELVLRCFIENSRGLIETACGWIRPASHFHKLVSIKGCEHMDAAIAQGRGVLLLGAHYSTLDFCANLLSSFYPFAATYRAHKNPLFDAFMLRGRLKNCNGVFDRADIRGAFRHLKQGKILWYAPDQDYGPEQSTYAPFFGNRAATITAASRFAAFNGSPVLFVRHHRLANRKAYDMEFIPVSDSWPSGDDEKDAALINQTLESCIRFDPAQYLWMHKRFKTQPGGKPQSPYIMIRTPNRKLSESQFALLTSGAQSLPDGRMQLSSGLQLRLFTGMASGLFSRHPALALDRLSKKLRAGNFFTMTVDNIFCFAFRNETGVTCYIPEGETLAGKLVDGLLCADLLFKLHECGFTFLKPQDAELIQTRSGLAIGNPLALQLRSAPVDINSRISDILSFATSSSELLPASYLKHCNTSTAAILEQRLAQSGMLADNASRNGQHSQP